MIVNRILVPGLGALRAAQPDLTVALVPEARNLDLTKREADLAVRFSRPVQGGLSTRAQKLGALEFATYCAAAVAPADEEALAWIGYDDAHSGLPQARWIEAEAADAGALRVADAETALEAVASGLGKSILPVAACRGDARMRRIPQRHAAGKLARDVWLLSHAGQAARSPVAVVKAWLVGLDWR